VILTGFQEDVAGYLGALDLLAVSSVLEGLNTSILDAMLAGVPVVATRTGGIPEVVRHLETGLLAAPGDPADLARQIAVALADRAGARERARRGRALVEREFTAEAMVEGTLAVYREALSGPS
jgi:glycosyltransferase involved in cell wall biosynthesis